MQTKTKQKTLKLVECSLLVALAVAIDFIPLPKWPSGGSVSLAMIVLIFCSYRHGIRWGMASGFVYSVIQMILGWYTPPANTIGAIAICVLLDYVLAFTALGSADAFRKVLGKNKIAGYAFGTAVVGIIRFALSFLSGIVIWGSYAPEGTPVWIYSMLYNGGYMLPNTLIAIVAIVLLCTVVDPITLRRNKTKQA